MIAVACAGVGLVVAWHRPRNALGWLFLGSAACFVLSTDSVHYAVADYRLSHGTWPLGPASLFLGPLAYLAIVALALVVLLFPDGRTGSRRWSRVLCVDLDAVRDDLSGVVHQALEPAHVSVWISHCD